MKAGCDLDILIAEKVMGYKVFPDTWQCANIDGYKFRRRILNYSSSIKDAWEIVDRFEGWAFELQALRASSSDKWEAWKVIMGGPIPNFTVIQETAELAICISALRAVGVNCE